MGDATGRSSCQDACEEAGLSEPQNGDLVQQVTADGDDAMPPEEQVTVFDYDGTTTATG